MTCGLKGLIALAALASLALSSCGTLPSDPLKTPLTSVANIQLPRPIEGASSPSLDLLTVDTRDELLFVPYTNTLNIVDLRTRKVRGVVPNLPGIKSIALSPDPNLVFTANGGNDRVSIVDVAKLQIIDEIKTPLGNPDAMVYDPVNDAYIVGQSGPAPNVAFIDRQSRKVTGSIKLPGAPELMAIDTTAGRVYLALHDNNEVSVIDVAARQVIETYKGCDIKSPVGMAFDPDQGRLFVANGIVHSANVASVIDVVLDKCLGSVDIGHGPDQAAINLHLHHLYVANSGTNNLSVIDTVSLKPLGVNGTGYAAHSVTADPTTDYVYVGVERAGIIAVYHDP